MPNIKNASASGPAVRKVPFAVSEAYKSIRTNLITKLLKEQKNVIAISSPNASEGKSTTAINIAISLSQLGKKVLLIDTDAHRPSIAAKLNIKNESGIMDVIVGVCDAEQAVYEYNSLLDIFTIGNIPQNPTEIFASSAFEDSLKEFSEKYDFVIIDTPPVNLLSDALVIAQKCEGLVLVVRSGMTTHSSLKHTISAAKMLDINILGLILNGTGGEKKRYYKDYYNKTYNNYR